MLLREFRNFMVEREQIRIRKERGNPWPWTTDVILRTYKFTNVHRSDDRTTKEFKKIYEDLMPYSSPPQMLYACGVCRYFGSVEFIKALPRTIMLEFNADILLGLAMQNRARGMKIFTSAYVITNGGRSEPKERVVVDYLGGLWRNSTEIYDCIATTMSWENAYHEMSELPGFGGTGFMAKEVLQDFLLCYPDSPISDRDTWTPMGLGARRGMNRVMARKVDFTQSEKNFISECQMLREQVNPMWPWQEELTAHDIQFQLCEFDKYMRANTGEGKPKARYHHD